MPAGERGWRTRLVPLAEDIVGESMRRTLVVLLGAVGLLLLVACANLSNLLLVRASARGFDLAVRQRARRIARPRDRPAARREPGGDGGRRRAGHRAGVVERRRPAHAADRRGWRRSPSTGGCSAVAVAATLDLRRARRRRAGHPRHARWRRRRRCSRRPSRLAPRSRLRDAMIVAQLALSLTLLVGAALVARSFWGLLRVDPGFSVDHVVTWRCGRRWRPSRSTNRSARASGRCRASRPPASSRPCRSGRAATPATTSSRPGRRGSPPGSRSRRRGGWSTAATSTTMRIPLLRGRTFDGLTPDEARRSIVLSGVAGHGALRRRRRRRPRGRSRRQQPAAARHRRRR